MDQIIDFLFWIAAGLIFLFLFILGVNHNMKKDSARAEEDSGD